MQVQFKVYSQTKMLCEVEGPLWLSLNEKFEKLIYYRTIGGKGDFLRSN